MYKMLKGAIALLIALVITAAAPVAFAQPESAPAAFAQPVSSDSSMETALIAAKDLLNIDDSIYTDFSYSSSYSNYETMEGLIWSFSWSDTNNSFINATVGEDGEILQYGKYLYGTSPFGFAEIDKDAAVAIADDFIHKAKPDTSSYYKEPVDVSISILSREYRIDYYADIDGYPFKSAQVSVSVDKFTGEVTGYNSSNISPDNFSFEDNDGAIISESDAIAAYAEKIGLSLEYRSYYNYEDGSVTVFPVYMLKSGSEYISAKTGDVVEYVYDSGMGLGGSTSEYAAAPMAVNDSAAEEGASGSRGALTPAEIDAINKVSNYITSDQALQKLLEAAELTDIDISAYGERYIGLNKDYYNRDRYVYDINMMRTYDDPEIGDDEVIFIYGRVDAETGRTISFIINYFGMPSSGEALYTEDQTAAYIDTFLKRIAPGEYAKSRAEEVEEGTATPYNSGGDANYNYIRYENGIPHRENGINITLNQITGKITRFNLNWYSNALYPDISNVITPQNALSKNVAQNGSSIGYITTGDGNASLVYEFNNISLIDPFDGSALDYRGNPLDNDKITPDYSDIAGHWSENVVKRLLDNGVYLWSGKFEPSKVMTEYEFLQYLLLLEQYYYYVEPVDFFSQRGIDIEADPDKDLTRQEAVRIIVEYLGYGKLAEKSEWFVYPFSDDVSNEYKGYITICYMLGIISGDNGRFNASANITRAQAAVILQNLIILKTV